MKLRWTSFRGEQLGEKEGPRIKEGNFPSGSHVLFNVGATGLRLLGGACYLLEAAPRKTSFLPLAALSR